jgi:Fe-S oxidoreductase
MRSRWTRDLDFKIPDARKEKVDSLWFLGDYASFDPRLQAVTSATARLFRKAGLDFGILYEGEQNSGNDVRRVGEEGLFQMLRDKNLKALENSDYRRIVTTDPHTYNALKNEYGINGSNGTQVLHYTELIDDLLRKGDLVPSRSSARRVTYHDPCYLGRYNGIYQPPRRILKALGLELVEMKRNHDRSYCCSAGGGKIWMEDPPNIRERSAETRVLEAAALDGVDTLVVACPKDIAMFQDAVKTTGLEDSLAVSDIAELVWEAVEGEAIGVSGNA